MTMSGRASAYRCPVCRKPVARDAPDVPFCGARCRQIDLARWADGDYRIPGEPATPWELNPADDA